MPKRERFAPPLTKKSKREDTHMNIVKIEKIENKIIEIRDHNVLLDSDVSELYEVETKRVNETVKNNPDKFPYGYLFDLSEDEWGKLKSKFSSSITPYSLRTKYQKEIH